MAQQRNTLLLVDALNLIRRVYAAQPGEDGPERAEGARASTVQSLQRGLRESAPTHAVCVFDGVFDGEGRSWRHELYPSYKAGHTAMPAALASALDGYRKAFQDIGVSSLTLPRLEADDVIATAASKAVAADTSAIILSTDKGFLQLLPKGVRVRDHFRRVDFDAQYVIDKFGVRPDQLGDFLALAGDRGNGIPGVPGIGAKSAAALLGRFETLESILKSTGDVEGKIGERLRDNADAALLYRTLVGLKTDLELGTNLSDLRRGPSDRPNRPSEPNEA